MDNKQFVISLLGVAVSVYTAAKGPRATVNLFKKTAMVISQPVRHPVKDTKAIYHLAAPKRNKEASTPGDESKIWAKWVAKVQACKCIKNADGKCMELAWYPNPYSRGSGTQFSYLPTCVRECRPGSSLTNGPDEQTRKELALCYVDWERLKARNPQWSDPNWTP